MCATLPHPTVGHGVMRRTQIAAQLLLDHVFRLRNFLEDPAVGSDEQNSLHDVTCCSSRQKYVNSNKVEGLKEGRKGIPNLRASRHI
jgi:hypothetical protein